MKTIITIQHTESVHHTNGMVGSRTDWPLTERGRRQAAVIARNLRAQLPEADWRLYTSDQTRARQTAEPIANAFQTEMIPCDALRERDLGEACGRSVAWLRANMAAERTVDDRMFPRAESRRDAWNRLRPFLTSVLNDDDGHILLVSHGDLLGMMNAMFLGMDVTALERYALNGTSGGVSFLTVDDAGVRRIARLGDRSFMLETD